MGAGHAAFQRAHRCQKGAAALAEALVSHRRNHEAEVLIEEVAQITKTKIELNSPSLALSQMA